MEQQVYEWESEVQAISKKYTASERTQEIIFYGASNFTFWTEMENDLIEYRIQNHGFGGSTDAWLVHYADRLLYPYDPRIVFLQTGSNDYVSLPGGDDERAEKCLAYKEKMYETFHSALPEAKIVVMSGLLLPGRSEYFALTNRINKSIKDMCSKKDYLFFVGADALTYVNGIYRKELFQWDGIHLNRQGQMEWCQKYIRPMIEHLVTTYELSQLRKLTLE